MDLETLLKELDIDVYDFLDIFESDVVELLETGSATIVTETGKFTLTLNITKET